MKKLGSTPVFTKRTICCRQFPDLTSRALPERMKNLFIMPVPKLFTFVAEALDNLLASRRLAISPNR